MAGVNIGGRFFCFFFCFHYTSLSFFFGDEGERGGLVWLFFSWEHIFFSPFCLVLFSYFFFRVFFFLKHCS